MSERYIHLGSKAFKLRTIDEYCKATEHIKTHEEWKKYGEEHPHYDVIYFSVDVFYDTLNGKVHNQINGMVGNMGGDFFWSSKYILEILRANNVADDDIPDFIKDYKAIEASLK